MKALLILLPLLFLGCNAPKYDITKESLAYRCIEDSAFIIYRYNESVTIQQVFSSKGQPKKCTKSKMIIDKWNKASEKAGLNNKEWSI